MPINSVSRVTEHAISEALSMSDDVVCVYVACDPPSDEHGAPGDDVAADLTALWRRWEPGANLEVLHTEFTSVIEPLLAYVDQERERLDAQIVVLIPVVVPAKLRYRLLHNQIDLVLSAALRKRDDVVVARVRLPIAELRDE